jgi:hypothetical protein
VSFAIHPSFYREEAVHGESLNGPLKIAAKDFCVCQKCRLPALRTCVGDVESGVKSHRYASGFEVHWFVCDACHDSLAGHLKPKCSICEDSAGLLRKTPSGHWLHYTCALLTPRAKILSIADMRFDLRDDGEINKSDHKKTRSKRLSEGPNIHGLLLSQTASIVSGLKEADDQDFTLLRFILASKEKEPRSILDQASLGDFITSNVDFNPISLKQKKAAKKKKSAAEDQVNVPSLFGIDSKEEFGERVEHHWNSQLHNTVLNDVKEQFELQMLPPGDSRRASNYCHCNENKELESYVSCDECQVWYHCSCVGVCLETLADADPFVCRKCTAIKDLESKENVCLSDLEIFKRERLNLDEMIMLGSMIEKAIQATSSVRDLEALPFASFDMTSMVKVRVSELAVFGFMMSECLKMLRDIDITSPYRDGSIEGEHFTRLKSVVKGSRAVAHNSASLGDLPEAKAFSELLFKTELVLQYYEELKQRIFRLPVLVSVAKRVELSVELRELQAHKDFLAALRTSKAKLDLILADFKEFSKTLDQKTKAGDLLGLQNSKLLNSRLEEYRVDLQQNVLAFKVVESLLFDLGLSEAEKNSEIPLKLDYFLVILKKELNSMFRAGDSEIARVWQEKSHLFEKSKVVIQKVQKLKAESPQWKDIADLDDPEAVLATRSEVEAILEESEDSVLVMNSALIKKLSDLKVASIKFEKKALADYWGSFDSSKRFIFTVMKSGILFSNELVRMTRELKLHSQIIKFCNHRGQFSVAELDMMLSVADRRFEKDYYDKADLLSQEIKVFINKASQLQDREDVWDDRVLEECLQLNKKLNDYRVKLPDTLAKFASITTSVSWLMDVAEQCGVIPDHPGSLLRYSFSHTANKLLASDTAIENLNIRTLVRLEKTHPPGVFVQHPSLLMLSTKTAKRVWQKDMEDVLVGSTAVHLDDLKYLLRKWSTIDASLTSLPREVRGLLDQYLDLKEACVRAAQGDVDLLPLDSANIPRTCELLAKITGAGKIVGIEGSIEAMQRCALMFLTFDLKIQKVLVYLKSCHGDTDSSIGQLEMSEIGVLCDLMQTVKKNVENECPLSIVPDDWTQRFQRLVDTFRQKVEQGSRLADLVTRLMERSNSVSNKIASMRKEKNLSLPVILEEIQHKPSVDEAKDILKKYQSFTASSDDNRRNLEICIDDVATINAGLLKLITQTSVSLAGTEDNKIKFAVFEKEFMRLLRRMETIPIYDNDFWVNSLAVNSFYKIYKCFFEPATFKRWAKVHESVLETCALSPKIEALVAKSKVLDGFTEQLEIIRQLTECLVKDKVSLQDVVTMEDLSWKSKVDKIGNVDLMKLREDCRSLNESMAKLKGVDASNKVGIEVLDQCKHQIEVFDLQVDEDETRYIYKAADNHRLLIKFLQGAQRDGFLSNGFLTDFIFEKYSESLVYSKPVEDLLANRATCLQIYQQVENSLKNLESDSYMEIDSKVQGLRHSWDTINKKYQLMAWLRKASAIHSGHLAVNLVALECLVQEGVEIFERSKKLIPKDQRILAICIVNKIGYLEDLINTADMFLDSLAQCTTLRELDEMKEKFREKDRIDLSSTIIDMRTQLNFGAIEYTRKKQSSQVPAIRESIGQVGPGEVGWDTQKDYRNIEGLFTRLVQQDRQTLFTKFTDMYASGTFTLAREPVHLSLEGTINSRGESGLTKRKPTKPSQIPSVPNQSMVRKSAATGDFVIRMDADEGKVSLVNSQALTNLSSVHVDLDAVTDSFRENILSNLYICLKENTHLAMEDSSLKSAAKNLEMHLFSNEHRSKSGYQKAYLFLRALLTRLGNFEAISKDLAKNNFSYEQIMQFRDKSDQRLLAFERELRATQDSKYNPLGIGFKPGPSKESKENVTKARVIESTGDKQYLTEVLQHLEHDRPTKTSKLMKALGAKTETEKKAKSRSKSVSRERSRSSSHGRKKHKKQKYREDRSEKKKRKEERKKRDADKAKFSSESENLEDIGGGFSDDDQNEGKFSPPGFLESSPVGTKTFDASIPQKPHSFENPNDRSTAQPAIAGKPIPGSWLKINYLKGKIRIFSSDAKKNENQGYSVSCNLYTSESEDVVAQFPDFSKVVTFVFDKYTKEAEDIELHYQRKISHQKRMTIPPSSQTILGGWIEVGEGDNAERERRNLGFLESYLSKKPIALSYNPVAGVTIWVVMGKWLKNETLKAIGVKGFYDSDQPIVLDKKIIFFLRRNIEKEEPSSKKLTSSIIQQYDRVKESRLKFVFGARSGPETSEKPRDLKKQASRHVNEGDSKGGNVDQEKPAMDESMTEMLRLFEGLNPEEVKDLFESITDVVLKQKLVKIISEHLPQFKDIVSGREVGGEKSLPPRQPTISMPMSHVAPHQFYPHPYMTMPPGQGKPPIGTHPPPQSGGYLPMNFDPSKGPSPAMRLPIPPQPGTGVGPSQHLHPHYHPFKPNLPMNPFLAKPPHMMMPMRPGVPQPGGPIGQSQGSMLAAHDDKSSLPPVSMNTSLGNGTFMSNPYPPMSMAAGGLKPPGGMPPLMYPPGVLPLGPGGYPMMSAPGMPYMYPVPPQGPQKPPIGQDSDKSLGSMPANPQAK